jgi:hypothetical protein
MFDNSVNEILLKFVFYSAQARPTTGTSSSMKPGLQFLWASKNKIENMKMLYQKYTRIQYSLRYSDGIPTQDNKILDKVFNNWTSETILKYYQCFYICTFQYYSRASKLFGPVSTLLHIRETLMIFFYRTYLNFVQNNVLFMQFISLLFLLEITSVIR